ncbi:hypothetical protein BC936DRAFT_147520 [Jimgerdemannia flammicorona]|uniref:Uncharacterized protein n=1 Tax=Jimgerdemannia flammicorona TaxID=994334 RepID=A0A433D552_9FUNG|nr:hypothetical protein BC936DRAFT_147520 [Jimgerdemannia flammicorona]
MKSNLPAVDAPLTTSTSVAAPPSSVPVIVVKLSVPASALTPIPLPSIPACTLTPIPLSCVPTSALKPIPLPSFPTSALTPNPFSSVPASALKPIPQPSFSTSALTPIPFSSVPASALKPIPLPSFPTPSLSPIPFPSVQTSAVPPTPISFVPTSTLMPIPTRAATIPSSNLITTPPPNSTPTIPTSTSILTSTSAIPKSVYTIPPSNRSYRRPRATFPYTIPKRRNHFSKGPEKITDMMDIDVIPPTTIPASNSILVSVPPSDFLTSSPIRNFNTVADNQWADVEDDEEDELCDEFWDLEVSPNIDRLCSRFLGLMIR